jgi:excisionase family DNA binding protein
VTGGRKVCPHCGHRDLVGTPAEVADALKCSENLVRKLIAVGAIPVRRLGRRTVIPWHRLELWLDTDPPLDELAQKRRPA